MNRLNVCFFAQNQSARNLEVCWSRGLPPSLAKQKRQRKTLFEVLNHCQTKMGARFLRSCIMQPPNDLPTIQLRLDTVEELLGKEDTFFSLVNQLAKMHDIDGTTHSKLSFPFRSSFIRPSRCGIIFSFLLL